MRKCLKRHILSLLFTLFSFIFTVLNILEKTPRRRLQEIIIVDDVNTPPITWNPDPSRVRIVRSGIPFLMNYI